MFPQFLSITKNRINKFWFFENMPFGYSKAERLSCSFQIWCVSFQEIRVVVSKSWRQAKFGAFSFKQDLQFQWAASETGNFSPGQTNSCGHRSVAELSGSGIVLILMFCSGGQSIPTWIIILILPTVWDAYPELPANVLLRSLTQVIHSGSASLFTAEYTCKLAS